MADSAVVWASDVVRVTDVPARRNGSLGGRHFWPKVAPLS